MELLMMTTDFFIEHDIKLPSIDDADANDNPQIVARFTNGEWNWYVIGGDKLENDDYYLFGVVEGIYREMGMFTLSQIESVNGTLTPDFDNIGLYDLFNDLKSEN